MYVLERILVISLIVSVTASGAVSASQVKIEKGDIAEIVFKPFIYINIKGYYDRESAYQEIRKDENGQLVPVTEARYADIVIAFLPGDLHDDEYGNIDPASIGPDPRGYMVAYTPENKDRIRIVWKDAKPNQPVFAMRAFIKVLNEYRDSHPWQSARASVSENSQLRLERLIITHKEPAGYDQEARQKRIRGTVVLNVLFTATGQLSEFRVLKGLPYGLTARALDAALRIQFKPATRDGVPISVRGNLEYSFKLY